jgi:hypothetical protein
LLQCNRVNARDRNERAEAIDDQQTKRKKDALAQFSCFAKGGPTDVGGHLLCCRSHMGLFSKRTPLHGSPGQRRWENFGEICKRRQGRSQGLTQPLPVL